MSKYLAVTLIENLGGPDNLARNLNAEEAANPCNAMSPSPS